MAINKPWFAFCAAFVLTTTPARAQPPTYAAGFYNLSVQAAATDVVCLENAGGFVTELWHMSLSGVGVAAGTINVSILMRATPNVGGTFIAPPPTPLSSDFKPATAVMKAYTANPTTLGTLVGKVREGRWDITTQGSNANPTGTLVLDPFYNPNVSRMVIKGSPGGIDYYAVCLSFNGGGPAASITGDMTWTEQRQ